MDVVAKPVQPTASAVIWGEMKPHHNRKEKAAEETKILAMSKKKKRISPENATNPHWVSDEHGRSLRQARRSA
jgi:hypothetical protein